MTVKQAYSCNFCGAEKPQELLHGVKWTSDGTLTKAVIVTVENHICLTCKDAIVALFGPTATTEPPEES